MTKSLRYIFLSAVRAAVKFFCFFTVFTTVNTLFLGFTEKFNAENRTGWSAAILIFSALSVAWVFYHYNNRAKRNFIKALEDSPRKNTVINALFSSDCLTDTAVCLILSVFTAFVPGYGDMERLFFASTAFHPTAQKCFIGIFIGLIFFFIHWFTVYDIRKKWAKDKECFSKHEILRIFAYLVFITVMYTVGFYIAMSYLPGLPAYIFLLKELFLYIVIAIAISIGVVYFNRIRKRKKFIAELKKLAENSVYTLSKIKNPYISVFKKTSGASFTVTVNQKSYDCKLISGKRKSVPIIFGSQGFLLYRHIIRLGKSELFSVYSKYGYAFESNTKKCLIITCIPANCYFKDENGRMRKIDTGEKIGEYTVFSASGFLGALERDCLDR